jgi:hypothetical protein
MATAVAERWPRWTVQPSAADRSIANVSSDVGRCAAPGVPPVIGDRRRAWPRWRQNHNAAAASILDRRRRDGPKVHTGEVAPGRDAAGRSRRAQRGKLSGKRPGALGTRRVSPEEIASPRNWAAGENHASGMPGLSRTRGAEGQFKARRRAPATQGDEAERDQQHHSAVDADVAGEGTTGGGTRPAAHWRKAGRALGPPPPRCCFRGQVEPAREG